MCGRYSLSTPGLELAEHFELDAAPVLAPRYNIAPTQEVPVVAMNGDRQRALGMMRWGIARRSGGRPLINLRSESAREMPSYQRLLERRRCLVVTDGFYEWKRLPGGEKRPYRVRMPGGRPFALAGIWTRGRHGDRRELQCTVLTTKPGQLSEIHDRSPVILYPSSYDQWLDPTEKDREVLRSLLQAYIGDLEVYPVSDRVNGFQNDDPSLLDPAPT